MTLRRVDSFATDSPDKLSVQLSQVEDNVTAALARVHSIPVSTDWISSDARPIQLAYVTITKLDTSLSALRATMPSINADTVWHIVGVRVKGASPAVVTPVESTAFINGFSSVNLNTGLHLFVHDGTEWLSY